MITIIYKAFFLLITIYILIKAIAYGLYEIRQQNNKYGGITVISFSCLAVLFSNIILWLK